MEYVPSAISNHGPGPYTCRSQERLYDTSNQPLPEMKAAVCLGLNSSPLDYNIHADLEFSALIPDYLTSNYLVLKHA